MRKEGGSILAKFTAFNGRKIELIKFIREDEETRYIYNVSLIKL